MTKNSTRPYPSGLTMAIFPNAIGFGYAVMKDAITVEDAQVVAIKQRPIDNQLVLNKVREKIAYFEPETIVVENTNQSKKSKRVSKLIQGIIDFAEERGVEVATYSRDDIRFVFSNFNAHSKHEIAKVIAENVDLMKHRLMKKRRCFEGEAYATGSFDAVSLGVTHFYIST